MPSAAAGIAAADDAAFAEAAQAARIPVAVDLRAPWCGPCRLVSPAPEQLARDLAGTVKLARVDVGTSPRISQRSGVRAIAALPVLRRGQVAARQAPASPGARPCQHRGWRPVIAALEPGAGGACLRHIADPVRHRRRAGLVMDRVEGEDQLEWRTGGQPGDAGNLRRDVAAGHLPGLVPGPGDGVAAEVMPGETRSGERGGHQADRASGAHPMPALGTRRPCA